MHPIIKEDGKCTRIMVGDFNAVKKTGEPERYNSGMEKPGK